MKEESRQGKPHNSPMDLNEGFRIGDWQAIPRQGALRSLISDQSVSLRPKAMQVLLELASAGGDVVGREALRDKVWPETLASDESLSRCIADIRAALASAGSDQAYIETLPKRGYRIVADIEPLDEDAPVVIKAERRRRHAAVITIVLLLGAGLLLIPQYMDRGRSPGATSAQAPNTVTARSENSIAVLPFVNISADEEQAYFADGLTEELISLLSRIPGLRVAARTSSFSFKGSDLEIPEIASRLNVAHILEGSVRKDGDQIRITAQLIQAGNGFQLWSETYERRMDSIFALQDEIATDIAGKLQLELGTIRIEPSRTSNLAAYDSYLRGLAALRQRSEESIDFFQDAILRDPGFAPAWASLAIAFQSALGSASDKQDRAVEAARRALELDPDNVAALTAMASVFRQTRRWLESEKLFSRALAIDPGSAELLEDYTEFLNLVGRVDEALTYSSRGMDIDPRILPLVAAHAEALLGNRDVAGARQVALDTMNAEGERFNFWFVLLPLWLTPEDEALQALPPTSEFPGQASRIEEFLKMPRDEAISMLEPRLQPGTSTSATDVLPTEAARLLLLHFGEIDAVMEYDIATAADQFPSASREWLWTPLFDRYRTHPKFAELLAVIGLVDYWDQTTWPEACRREGSGGIECR
ncbi:MAG: winged helix-turn-helix domain-containing protein [Xanthomonadales bacterium]|nr:winged helix-turn-helix domain-containing protein [Xanthomonadales bacterium]